MLHWRCEGEQYRHGISVGWVRGPFIALVWRSGVYHRRVKLRWRYKFWLYHPWTKSLLFDNLRIPVT